MYSNLFTINAINLLNFFRSFSELHFAITEIIEFVVKLEQP